MKRLFLWIITVLCFAGSLVLTLQPKSGSEALSRKITDAGTRAVEQYDAHRESNDTSGTEEKPVPKKRLSVTDIRAYAHSVMFFVLLVFFTMLLNAYRLKLSAMYSAGFCAVYSYLSEVIQEFFTDGRTFEVGDIVRNLVGGAAGIVFAFIIHFVSLAIAKHKRARKEVIGK